MFLDDNLSQDICMLITLQLMNGREKGFSWNLPKIRFPQILLLKFI